MPSSAVVGSSTGSGYTAASDYQGAGISGVGTFLPAGYNQVVVTDDSMLYSYNTGTYAVAGVILSTVGYYWNLPSSSFPAEGSASQSAIDNLDIIQAGNGGFNGSFDPLGSTVGTLYSDQVPSSFTFSGLDPSEQYYLSFLIQNTTDTDPIWADLSDVNVYESNVPSGVATPEPSSLALLGLGALGLFFRRKKVA